MLSAETAESKNGLALRAKNIALKGVGHKESFAIFYSLATMLN